MFLNTLYSITYFVCWWCFKSIWGWPNLPHHMANLPHMWGKFGQRGAFTLTVCWLIVMMSKILKALLFINWHTLPQYRLHFSGYKHCYIELETKMCFLAELAPPSPTWMDYPEPFHCARLVVISMLSVWII